MSKIRVWTKQHRSVWEELKKTGRYTAKREYIVMELQEHAGLVLEVYDWLVKHGPDRERKPSDVTYPVWVSFKNEATMMKDQNSVILELSLEPDQITPVNIEKWGTMLNYSYIPKDEADAKRHRQLLEQYGVSDTRAYMTQFYPEIKREIVDSWDRLFDDRIILGSDAKYGTIWEIRREWVTQVSE